jgi:hypothetical protein
VPLLSVVVMSIKRPTSLKMAMILFKKSHFGVFLNTVVNMVLRGRRVVEWVREGRGGGSDQSTSRTPMNVIGGLPYDKCPIALSGVRVIIVTVKYTSKSRAI